MKSIKNISSAIRRSGRLRLSSSGVSTRETARKSDNTKPVRMMASPPKSDIDKTAKKPQQHEQEKQQSCKKNSPSKPTVSKTTETQLPVQTRTLNILVGVTGSVATIKLIELIKDLNDAFPMRTTISGLGDVGTYQLDRDVKFKIVMTQNSQHFLTKKKIISELKDLKIDEVYTDSDEWSEWKQIGDPVLHIELRKWADVFVLAPLDANTMGKMVNGICDNLVTCIVRAWDLNRPLVFCPAMNCHMYEHPITKTQVNRLCDFGYICVDPIVKRLACGDIGVGAMAPVQSITRKVIHVLTTDWKRDHEVSMSVDDPPAIDSIVPRRIRSTGELLRASGSIDNIDISKLLNTTPKSSNTDLSSKLVIHINPIKQNAPPPTTTESNSQEIQFNQIQIDDRTFTSVSDPNPLIVRAKVNTYSKLSNNELSTNGFHNDYPEFPPEFDPTLLMEQSLITRDEPVKVIRAKKLEDCKGETIGLPEYIDTPGSSSDEAKSQIMSDEYIRHLNKFKINSSVLNNAQFLALCTNKERSCFTCAICKHDYKNRKSMTRHFKEQHVQGCIYKCGLCNVAYKRREKLIKHNREFHPSPNDKSMLLGASSIKKVG